MNYTVSLCWLCSTVCFIIYYCGHRDCLLLLCTGCMHSRRPHDGYFLYFVQYWVLLINIDVLCKDVVKNSTAVSMFLSFRASLTIDCNLQTDFRVLRLGGWGGGLFSVTQNWFCLNCWLEAKLVLGLILFRLPRNWTTNQWVRSNLLLNSIFCSTITITVMWGQTYSLTSWLCSGVSATSGPFDVLEVIFIGFRTRSFSSLLP